MYVSHSLLKITSIFALEFFQIINKINKIKSIHSSKEKCATTKDW